MPRQVDLHRGQVTNNPLSTVSPGALAKIIHGPPNLAKLMEQILTNGINNLLGDIDKVTGLDLLGFARTLEDTFGGSGDLLGGLKTFIDEIDASVQNFLDAIANAFGHSGVGHTITQVQSYLEAIPGDVISGVTTIEQAILDAIANALGHTGTGHTTTDIETYLGEIPGDVISGITAVEQDIIDKACNALGVSGTGHSTADLLAALEAIPGDVVDASVGFLNQSTSLLKHLGTGGSLGIYDASVGFVNQSTSLLKNLSASTFLYDASAGFGNQSTSLLKYIGTGVSLGLYDASQGFVNQSTSALKNLGTGVSLGLYDASQGFNNASTSMLKFLTATGGAIGQFDASALANIANIPAIAATKISAVLGGANLGADVQAVVDKFANLFNADGSSGNPISALLTDGNNALHGLLPAVFDNLDGTGAPLSGITFNGDRTATYAPTLGSGPIYALVDAADGTASTVATMLQNLGNPTGTHNYMLANWQALLAKTGLANVPQLVSSLGGLIPAALDNADGTAVATGVAQIVQNLDGTATHIEQTVSSGVAALKDNLDGTAMSVAHMLQNLFSAPSKGNVTAAITHAEQVVNSTNGLGANGATPATTAGDVATALAGNSASQSSANAGYTNGGGITTAISFADYPNSAALPVSDWDDFGSGSQPIAINNGYAIGTVYPGGSAEYRNRTPTSTDNQIVKGVWASSRTISDGSGGTGLGPSLRARMDSTGTNYILLQWIELIGQWSLTSFPSGTSLGFFPDTFTPFAEYALICNGRTFSVLKNGVPLGLPFVDGGSITILGASDRYGGLGYQSCQMSMVSWLLSDYVPNPSLTVENNLTLSGTDGTAFVFPSTSGTLALAAPAPAKAFNATSGTTSSSTYTSTLTGRTALSVTVTVGPSGNVMVGHSAQISNSAAGSSFASWAASGANTIAAADEWALENKGTSPILVSRFEPVLGINPGVTTFTQEYNTAAGATTGTFADCKIWAVPL